MSGSDVLQRIKDVGVVAIVRGTSPDVLGQIVGALKDGGVRAVEVTFNTGGAVEMLKELADKYGADMQVGAGTVLDSETARVAILAGATFILTPILNHGVIQMGHRYGVQIGRAHV